MRQKLQLKHNIVNAVLSLAVVIIGAFAFKFTGAPIENWFYPIIFILVLIYLELIDKKGK